MLIAAAALIALPAHAQRSRLSPPDITGSVIDGNRVSVVYSRPHTVKPGTTEVRKIWGGLVPYGKVWRLGANEATLLITQQPIQIGDTTIPAGAHTLFMLPEEDGPSKLIINNQIGQWGTQYNQAEDLARVDLDKKMLDEPVDQLTMAIVRNPSGGGILKLSWEKTEYSVPFTVQR